MRITKISVKGLFGMFDHEIPLNQESRITIVHGPNGVGKTVLLELVHALFHYEYERFWITPFESLQVELEGRLVFHVIKMPGDVPDGNYKIFGFGLEDLAIEDEDRTELEHIPFFPNYAGSENITQFLKEIRPDLKLNYFPRERHQMYWVSEDDKTEVFVLEDLLILYPELHNIVYGEAPEWFQELMNEADLEYVSTGRLKSDSMFLEWQTAEYFMELAEKENLIVDDVIPSPPNTLETLFSRASPTKLKARYHASHLNMLRILEGEDSRTVKLEKLGAVLDELETWLARDDVIGRGSDSDLTTEGVQLQVQRDFDLAVDLFLSIVNSRVLFKDVSFDREMGLRVVAEHGNDVPLSALSSGEEQLLVLYYKLLFEFEDDTLVMIDEPELSMNVVWQRNFLKDLQRIIELRKFDVLIATHSPQIIHDKWDWVVHLGEKVDD
ncbi:MAG: AAA family ATPase [Chloroflexi bacterium]|nr:AAA family ATPase [Chloroflexota bacterium]